MKPIKYSFNFKILAGIITLLLVCTSFNLIYSYKIFIDDKTSYIFETSLNKVEALVNQFQFQTAKIKSESQNIYFLSSLNNFDMQNYTNSDETSLYVGLIELENNNVKYSTQFTNGHLLEKLKSKYNLSQEDFKKELESRILEHNKPSFNDIEFIQNQKGGNFILSVYKKENSPRILFKFTEISNLMASLHNDSIFTHSLVFLDNPKLNDPSVNEWLSNFDYKNIRKGAKEIKVRGTDKLASYAKSSDSKYLIASFIDSDKAFSITQFLIIKTILFAMTLLGLAIAVGIYFAATITHPIKILTEKTKNVSEGDFTGVVDIRTTDELSVLGATFNLMNNEIRSLLLAKEEMIIQLEKANVELENYSKNLELMVAQRTLELKNANDFMNAMVNSLDQGLLVFDNELRCNAIFTKACEPIFGLSPLGKTFLDVLQVTAESEVASIHQWSQILFKELIPFESAIDLGPKVKINGLNFQSTDFKHVQLNYYPIRDDETKDIKNMVVVATDKTNEIQAIEKEKENEQFVSMILKILKNKTQFQSFCSEVADIFEQFPSAYDQEKKTIHYDRAMMLFHSLNGGFGMFSIYKLQQMSVAFENEIDAEKNKKADSPSDNFLNKMINNINKLSKDFEAFKLELDQLIGTKFASGDATLEITKEQVNQTKEIVDRLANSELKKVFYENFVKVPIINYFSAYNDFCKNAAEKFGKKFNGLTFHNENLKIDPSHFGEFFNVLVHLFRNCIDHGLEEPNLRRELNKTEIGRIDVSFELVNSNDNNFLRLTVQDDGAGINPEIIRNRYNLLHPDKDLSSLSDKEVIYKIFDAFFTTREQVTSLSGRGVGMSAIQDVVDLLKGRIEIESKVGKGTIFTFEIPMPSQQLA